MSRSAPGPKYGRLDALHEKYSRHNLRGLWQRGEGRVSGLSSPIWRWLEILPILEESLEIVRLPEDTDQRVIGLVSPGKEGANRALSMAYQLLNPGETVRSHRHTPTQMRFIVKGRGAYTTSEGEQMLMEPGDLLVQTNWSWHGSANFGEEPVLWLDLQDRSLVNYLGAFMREFWPEDAVQPTTRPEEYHRRLSSGVRPLKSMNPNDLLPPFQYKWKDTLRALEDQLESENDDPYDGVLFEYGNPFTGGHTVPTMSAQIQVLRPGQSTLLHRHTGTTMHHVVEGQGSSTVGDEELQWREGDCFFIPPLQWHRHQNSSKDKRAMLFSISDRPILDALGLYREEGK